MTDASRSLPRGGTNSFREQLASAISRPVRGGYGRVLVHGTVFAGWLFLLIYIPQLIESGLAGRDAITYWSVDPGTTYLSSYGDVDYFPYTPAAALVASLFKLLPWPAFLVIWWALLIGVLAWLGGSVRSLVALLAIPPVFLEVLYGNIHILLAAAVVLGFRWPVAWSFLLLTKVTPGIGLLWFAARREWRSLMLALGATAVITAVSFAIAPQLWQQWLNSLMSAESRPILWGTAIAVPLPIRLAIALPLVIWGARTNRRWTVAVAVTLALPVLWVAGLSVLVACWPLLRARALTPKEAAALAPIRQRTRPVGCAGMSSSDAGFPY